MLHNIVHNHNDCNLEYQTSLAMCIQTQTLLHLDISNLCAIWCSHGLLPILRTWDDIFWSSDGLNKQTRQLSQWTCWKRYVVVNYQSIPFSPSMYVGFWARRQDALLLGGCLERTLGLWWHCWLPKIPLLTDSSSYLVRLFLFLWGWNFLAPFNRPFSTGFHDES